MRSVVLRQVEVWVGSVTAVGARSGLEGHGESGFGTGMARFGLAVPFRLGLTGFGWARCGKFRCGGRVQAGTRLLR